jgi:membrane associated rhomboid family serine protease
MLPLADEDSGRKFTPWVTIVVIIINVIVFLIELSQGEAFIERWAFVPNRFLENPAANIPTLFTSMFMHGGWMHLIGNMLYLWIFGDNIESHFGHVWFIGFYVLSGIAATFSQMIISMESNVPLLGASGAIAGVLGAYLLLFPKQRVRVLAGRRIIALPALIVIGFWFVLQVLRSFLSFSETTAGGGVAYLAHVGGFVAGLLLAFIFRKGK